MIIIKHPYLLTSGELQITVEGESRNATCIGENVTYTCDADTIVHTWNIPGVLPVDALSIVSNNRVGFITSGQFTVRIVATEPRFVTSLLVIAYQELNGSTITCTAGSASVADQSTIAIVVGKLNYAPRLCITFMALFFNNALFSNIIFSLI